MPARGEDSLEREPSPECVRALAGIPRPPLAERGLGWEEVGKRKEKFGRFGEFEDGNSGMGCPRSDTVKEVPCHSYPEEGLHTASADEACRPGREDEDAELFYTPDFCNKDIY